MTKSEKRSFTHSPGVWNFAPHWSVKCGVQDMEVTEAKIVGDRGDEQLVVEIEVTYDGE